MDSYLSINAIVVDVNVILKWRKNLKFKRKKKVEHYNNQFQF